jgi:organic hydroperoxide reductase OsmC/OhrA
MAMHMHGQEQRNFTVTLHHESGYRFVSQATEDGRKHGDAFASDEPDPVGDASAPATPALLGAAVGHCLSASLLETMRHAHLPVADLQTDVNAVVALGPEGLPRIHHIDVVLRPVLRETAARARRCEEVFERHCTVTSSVRQGIDVRVRVDWGHLPDDAGVTGSEPGI